MDVLCSDYREIKTIFNKDGIDSVNEYIENPKIWVNNSQRIFSINRFKDKYCKTSSQWYTDWSCYFDSL